MFKHVERELDDMDESDKWKIDEDEDETHKEDDAGPGQ